MALLNTIPEKGAQKTTSSSNPRMLSAKDKQRMAKMRALERRAHTKNIKLMSLCVFTQQLSSMLEAGLPLVSALEALEDQTEDPVFRIIIRDVRTDVSGGNAFSEAARKFPNAFPNLFVSMVEAGEASGGLSSILDKVAKYFEDTVKLMKKVKGAMMYPIGVITLAVVLVNVLLIKVIPVFAEMFKGFGKALPAPTQMLIDLSAFLGSYWWMILVGLFAAWKMLSKFISTPKGRIIKDQALSKVPVVGPLLQKVALSRFCRTYSILLRSGVPILRTLEIVSNASGNTYIEHGCREIIRGISQGGQLSDTVATLPYFPPTIKHMARAGEQTGNVEGMMNKIADFYDAEVETLVDGLTSLMEPILIVFLGTVIGGIVMAMFMPIFEMANVAGS
jgi:type IV pilus assembly protein PilC